MADDSVLHTICHSSLDPVQQHTVRRAYLADASVLHTSRPQRLQVLTAKSKPPRRESRFLVNESVLHRRTIARRKRLDR
jgi:hypothetical protein